MTVFDWVVQPRDSVIARDGRPFGADSGHRVRSLDWLLPSTTSGTVRTLLGKLAASGFDETAIRDLKDIAIAGPLVVLNDQLLLPAARDLVFSRKHGVFRLRPKVYSGTDLPGGMAPSVIEGANEEDFKPDSVPDWWPTETMISWLCDGDVNISGKAGWRLMKDTRTHVAIGADAGVAEDEMLFQTTGLVFDGIGIALRVSDPGDFHKNINGHTILHPVGGERRLAEWTKQTVGGWALVEPVRTSLASSERLRMVLATPAIFAHGWRPAWLGDDLKGTIPGTQIAVKLISAVTSRWQPVSGWSYDSRDRGKRQKPVRRMVPSGSVFFFERTDTPKPSETLPAWLGPVSDDDQDCRDGFGLAVWGTWDYCKEAS